MKFAAIALLTVTATAWAEQPTVTVSLKPGQRAAITVSKDQPVSMECIVAKDDQTIGENRAAQINRKVAEINAGRK